MALADITGTADRRSPFAVAAPAAVVCAAPAPLVPLSVRVSAGLLGIPVVVASAGVATALLRPLDHRRQTAISRPGAHEPPRDRQQQDRRGGRDDKAAPLSSPRFRSRRSGRTFGHRLGDLRFRAPHRRCHDRSGVERAQNASGFGRSK